MMNKHTTQDPQPCISVAMAELVSDLLKTYPRDDHDANVWLEREVCPANWLLIKQVDSQTVQVGWYVIDPKANRAVPAPALLFYVHEQQWVPMRIDHVYFGTRRYVHVDAESGCVNLTMSQAMAAQKGLTLYCDLLAAVWRCQLRL